MVKQCNVMIEEVQVRPLKRRTRGERTKRRERYLLHSGMLSCKLENKSPQRLPSASEIPENNNCLNCRQRLQRAKEKESPPPAVQKKVLQINYLKIRDYDLLKITQIFLLGIFMFIT